MHDASGSSSIADELESCGQPYVKIAGQGVYTLQTKPMCNWWHKNRGKNAIDISRPHHYKRLGLVMRTATGCYLSPYKQLSPNCWELRSDYLPVELHVTIVVVAPGATFSGWQNYVGSVSP
jgi:hypothetical protein